MNDAIKRIAILALGPLLCQVLSCTPSDETCNPDVARYQIQGQVVRPVVASGPQRLLWLQHEPIPEFVGIGGKVEGMDSMTMSFVVADEVDLAGIDRGAKISFELTVDWSASIPGQVTSIEVLPTETQLFFEASD